MKKTLKNKHLRRIALVIFTAHTIVFLTQIPQVYLYGSQNPAFGGVWNMIARLAWGSYFLAVVTPFILWLGYHLPITRRHLWRNLILHLVFSILAGIVHHFGYGIGIYALNLSSNGNLYDYLFSNPTSLFNNISVSILRYSAIIGIQQAYLYYRESQERAFDLQRAELEVLRMQMRPHFFFNTLNAVSALMHRSPRDADRMIVQLGDIFRIALKKDKAQEISLKEELEFTRSFLQIHQTLMGRRLKIEWKVAPESLDALVPNLILQPLAENAIQHGLAPLEAGGRIMISAVRQNGHLLLQVDNDGQGIAARNGDKSDGIGLSNTRARLENLYGDGQDFSIDEQPEGNVIVKIKIPFRSQTTN